jgi:hypothetical protein
MDDTRYRIRIIRGAFLNQGLLDRFSPVKIENVDDPHWISIEECIVTLLEIIMLQKDMIKHAPEDKAVWYLDGYEIANKEKLVVAFGADDGEGGKYFLLERSEKDKIREVQEYGISKGIPKGQLNFADIIF